MDAANSDTVLYQPINSRTQTGILGQTDTTNNTELHQNPLDNTRDSEISWDNSHGYDTQFPGLHNGIDIFRSPRDEGNKSKDTDTTVPSAAVHNQPNVPRIIDDNPIDYRLSQQIKIANEHTNIQTSNVLTTHDSGIQEINSLK